jgi:hypothetical protein
MIGSQIANLNPGLSFGHNLCFNYPNVSYEPILNIYVPRAFQGYKEHFNSMGFDPYNHSLKIWESIKLQLPRWELTWQCGGSFSHTLPHSQEHEIFYWASLLARTFASLCLVCEPKARVATMMDTCVIFFMMSPMMTF